MKKEGVSECEQDSKFTGPVGTNIPGSVQKTNRSKEWILQLNTQVTQLLQLCSMEVEDVKQQLQKARKDREEFRSRVSIYKFLLETIQILLSKEVCKTQALKKHAAS